MIRSPLRFRPSFESLEGRLTPAGAVTVSVAGATLFVQGDNLANNVQILEKASGTFAVLGVDTAVRGPATRSGIRNIVVSLNGGDDDVTFSDPTIVPPFEVQGDLTVNGGQGGNTLRMWNPRVLGNLTITNGDGSDYNLLFGLTVFGNVAIDNGDGGGDVSAFGFLGNGVRGNFTIRNGKGAFYNELDGLGVGGDLTITNGPGGFADNSVDGDLSQGVVTIGGNLTITNAGSPIINRVGRFDDRSSEGPIQVNGNLRIANGAGGAYTELGSDDYALTVHGSLTLTGTGRNTLTVGHAWTGQDMTVDGGVRILTGSAPDDIYLDHARINGGLTADLGAGDNNFYLGNATVSGPIALSTGAGNDVLTLLGDSVLGTLKITTGGGADTVNFFSNGPFAPSVFNQAVTVDTGEGNDTVSIQANGSGAMTFYGPLAVQLGAGNDSLQLATQGTVALYTKALFDGGVGTNVLTADLGNVFAFGPPPMFLHF